jgi:ABC-type branched-subunit amino acid transport system ATPase component
MITQCTRSMHRPGRGWGRGYPGSVMFDGQEIAGRKSHTIALAGMQLVHEDRRIFGSLDVEENLVLAGLTAQAKWPLERIYGKAVAAAARICLAASSRCWRSRARSSAIPKSSCWMSLLRGLLQ